MKETDAVFGGELSGHYYFREHYYADSGMMALVKMLDLLGREQKPVSDLIAPLQRTFRTGEVNFKFESREKVMTAMEREFSDVKHDTLDGITVEYDDWWFNVRFSNTEPLVRLNLEASTQEQLEKARRRLSPLLGTPE